MQNSSSKKIHASRSTVPSHPVRLVFPDDGFQDCLQSVAESPKEAKTSNVTVAIKSAF
jgi:hypothetical protein